MLCERCGKHEATTHLRESINGDIREIHLCSQCAAELGYDHIFKNINPFAGFDINVNDFLGSLFAQSLPGSAATEERRCSFCGTTFEEFAENATAGCSHCYNEFYDQLLPYIQRIHGKVKHVGKIPAAAGRELREKREIESLQQQLKTAVDAQEYEKAAQLRDKIKELEKKVQGK